MPERRLHFVVVSLYATTLLAPAPSLAWSTEGHKLICEIAWQRFSPATKAFVQRLRKADPAASRTFSDDCNWADRVKRKGQAHPETYAYHFVNIPSGSDGFQMARDCPAPKRCVVWAIDHFLGILSDSGRPDRERAEALKFLAHFLGDVHQPLHAGRPEDYGGNTIRIDFFGRYGGCWPKRTPLDLHEVWDRSIIERAKWTWPASAVEMSKAIEPTVAEAWRAGSPRDWANESFRLCEEFVYDLRDTTRHCVVQKHFKIRTAYYEKARAITRQRLQQAGVRLAHWIDRARRGQAPGTRQPSSRGSRQR